MILCILPMYYMPYTYCIIYTCKYSFYSYQSRANIQFIHHFGNILIYTIVYIHMILERIPVASHMNRQIKIQSNSFF